jgi:outer membrane lipoprotein-sorting protein
MKWLACLSALAVFGIGAAIQSSLPPLLQQHLKTLMEAKSLTGTINVTTIGSAPVEYKFSYTKPNLLRVSYPDGFTVIDGKTLTKYSAKDKTYTVEPATDDSVKASLPKELWAWTAFFAKEDKDFAKGGKSGITRKMKGVDVTEVAVVPPTEGFGTVTLYVDPKLGFARGFNLKEDSRELLVMATELKASSDPLADTEFAFVAPAGSKKVEAAAANALKFAEVEGIFSRNCMPCHSAGQMAAGINLTTYAGVRATVVPGNLHESRLIKSLHGAGASQMPKNRPALPDDQIKKIEQWVRDGANP